MNANASNCTGCKCEGRECIGIECFKKRTESLVSQGKFEDARCVLEEAIAEHNDEALREELRTVYGSIVKMNNKRPDNLNDSGCIPVPIPSSSDRHMFTINEKEREEFEQDVLKRQQLFGQVDENGKNENLENLEKVPSKMAEALTNIFSCLICSELLFQPVTTPCGHTYCRGCLCKAIQFTDTCPMCRTILHTDAVSETSINTTLQDTIQTIFPEECEERRVELREEVMNNAIAMRRLPIFPLDTVCFPEQHFPMHIFEQRYRTMLKRVMKGSRKFGIVKIASSTDKHEKVGDLCKVGCVVEITKSQLLPDGRCLVDTVGKERFEILSYSHLDGYIVGDVKILHDNDVSTEEMGSKELEERARSLMDDLVNSADRLPFIQRVLQAAGQFPPKVPSRSKGPGPLGLWIAGLLVLTDSHRQRYLEMTNSEVRLKEMVIELEKAAASWKNKSTRMECPIQ